MFGRLWRFLLRELARKCVMPGMRHRLFRLSGVDIGVDTFINMRVEFVDNYRGGGAISLGERVAVAPGAMFLADSDPNRSRLGRIGRYHTRGKVTIEDDVWIGARAILLPNVRVGHLAIVGAGAVVTKDVEPYAIVAGIPARKIGDVRDEPEWKDEDVGND